MSTQGTIFPIDARRPHHPHAALLGALSTALGTLDACDRAAEADARAALARAMAGIDFDLPSGAPSAADRVQLAAAAPLYFASELERAALLPTAELIAGLFASGAITQPLGPVAQLLHGFWRGRRDRLEATERNAIFSRVFEAPHFDRMMSAVCTAIVAQADGDDLREQVTLATQAQSLAAFLAQRVDPMATLAARDIVATINTALQFLRDRQLQAAFAVNSLWNLVGIAAPQTGVSAGLAQQHVERGRSGQTVLLWLVEHHAENAVRLDIAAPDQTQVLVAAQRWLASRALLASARPPASAPHAPVAPAPAPEAPPALMV